MKKIYPYLMMLCLGLFSLSLTSCEEDDDYEVAATLDGIWHGSLGSYYTSVYGYGYSEWETEFRFYNDGGSFSGRGVEVDYDPSYWSDYKYYPFKWSVANGNIYLYFDNEDELVIRNYYLTPNWLSGTLQTIESNYTVANLRLERVDYWPWSVGYAKATRATDTQDEHYGAPRNLKISE